MLWIVLAAAIVFVVALGVARSRRQVPRGEGALSHYHDGLDALSRIEQKRSL